MRAGPERNVCAAANRRLRQAAAKTRGMLQLNFGAIRGADTKARTEIANAKPQVAPPSALAPIGRAVRLLGTLCQTAFPTASAASQPIARGGLQRGGRLARPLGATSAFSSPRQPPQASPTKARPNARVGKAVPNRSVKASPNSWPGLPFLGDFSYRPIQVMPGQLSAPPYLER